MSEWTHPQLDQLDEVVASLLSAPLPQQVLWALAQQQRLIETAYRRLGQQREYIGRLHQEILKMRGIIEDGDDDALWDLGDERRW